MRMKNHTCLSTWVSSVGCIYFVSFKSHHDRFCPWIQLTDSHLTPSARDNQAFKANASRQVKKNILSLHPLKGHRSIQAHVLHRAAERGSEEDMWLLMLVPDNPPDRSHRGVRSGTATQHLSKFYKHETDSNSQNPGGDHQCVPVDLIQPVSASCWFSTW